MKKQIKILFNVLICTCLLTSCISQEKSKTDAILNNDSTAAAKKSIVETISGISTTSIEEIIDYYYKLKKENPEAYNFDDENELNNYGYQLLDKGKIKDAIKIFELLVAEFPNSSNPYDSLGEAYYADGNKELAVQNYEKSLKLNPKNINAEDWINKIKYAAYDSTRFHKMYSIKQYKNDLDELGRRLTEVNPNAYKFITKDAFWKAIEVKKSLITERTTFSEFIWHCSEVIANISCSHTSMGYFNQERKMIPIELRFPIEVKLINDKLYVSDPLVNREIVTSKSEITSINGVEFETIKTEIFNHISSQGNIETYKKNFINSHSTSIIPYALGFPKSYVVTIKGKSKPVKLKTLTSYQNNFQKLPEYLCQERLCLKYSENNTSAIMTIRSFAYYGSKFPEFKAFIDTSFKELEQKKIKNLVIDVRGNGGGPSDAGVYLLRYLAQKPFVYFSNSQFNEKLKPVQPFENGFKNNLYFTIDGNGGSTTGHFMSLVKHLKLATLVGEELGSNQFCTGGQKRLRLPYTGIIYAVSRNTYVTTATSLPVDRGIMPDYTITQSIDDYLNKVDTVMEYTLRLIEKK
ncbi:tetratricopeptide repeat protein [Aquimarina sp. MAR_2010_214]|uniref:S41 family peptidase n=1 Tax=Aquimarina sp. MAR_2010_214 TaxID=1250026 RepID=UPI000C71288B|nr:S41 family peptidase [Aquimarina sp. MAR_2010_214]PKV51302.1 tetratricopeptide repeat protein [Aquimarina sp. MAR_2010_214]